MTKTPHVPPTFVNPEQPLALPFVPLGGCQTQQVRTPNGEVHLLVGPLMLVLPFTSEMAKKVGDELKARASGVIVPEGI